MIVALVMEVTTGLFTGAATAHGLLASPLCRVARTDGKSLWNITKRCFSFVSPSSSPTWIHETFCIPCLHLKDVTENPSRADKELTMKNPDLNGLMSILNTDIRFLNACQKTLIPLNELLLFFLNQKHFISDLKTTKKKRVTCFYCIRCCL